MPHIVMRRGRVSGLAVTTTIIVAAALAGCASAPPPQDKVALATAAVDVAVSAGAGEFATAELNQARGKLETANAAMAQREYGKAQVMAEQAEADAMVARAKASAEKARRAADEVDNSLRALRETTLQQPAPVPPATSGR